MIAKVRTYEYDQIVPKIEKLIDHQNDDDFTIVSLMKDVVEEFKSQNSVFEAIDNEREKQKQI